MAYERDDVRRRQAIPVDRLKFETYLIRQGRKAFEKTKPETKALSP
jgi:hypothetical protein